MKKIITSLFASVLLVFGLGFSTAHAQTFNNDPKDLPTVMVLNASNSACSGGWGQGCWKTSVSADAGDTVSVRVYFHNTSPSTAYNVAIGMSPQNTSAANSATFSGRVLVGGRSAATGSAIVNLSSTETLTFIPGSVKLYINQTAERNDNPTVVGGTAVFSSSGLAIGDILPNTGNGTYSWEDSQGSVVASFKVSNTGIVSSNNCSLFLSSNTNSVVVGNPATLSWSSSNCTNLQISGIGSVGTSGSQVVYPAGVTTYTLTGQGNNGVQQSATTIHTTNNNIYVPPVNNSCSVWSFAPEKTYINRGENTTLRWNTNASYVVISPLNINNGSPSSSTPVGPSTTTTYFMTAYCGNGSSTSASTTISVANATASNMQVTTTNATSLRTGSAQLNGITAPNNNGTATAWFEYGLTGSLGNRTSAQTVSSGNNSYFNDYISGLAPNTWYYYRAILQNSSGTVNGEIVRFKTLGGAVDTTYVPPVRTVKPVQIINNTVVAQSAPSLLELKVNSQYDRMCVNGDMQYVVTYRNISGVTLKDTVLRITHPKELTFIASTQGRYEVVDRVVTVDVGDVGANQSGIVTLTFRVNSEAVRGALAVTTATVVYTNPNTKAQEDATAYSLINVSDDCPTLNNLQGNAFGAGFLPNTLLEWLLLILVILGLIILARQLYKKSHQQA